MFRGLTAGSSCVFRPQQVAEVLARDRELAQASPRALRSGPVGLQPVSAEVAGHRLGHLPAILRLASSPASGSVRRARLRARCCPSASPATVKPIEQALGRQQRGLHAADMGGDIAGERIHAALAAGAPEERVLRQARRRTRRNRRRKPPGRAALANSAASGFSRKASSSSSQVGSSSDDPGDVEAAAVETADIEQHADPGEQRIDIVIVRVPDRARWRRRRRTMRCVRAGRGSPGSTVSPPRLGKHQGARVTSISRAGSQTPSERPMRGIGEPQRQSGEDGLGVSGAPAARADARAARWRSGTGTPSTHRRSG